MSFPSSSASTSTLKPTSTSSSRRPRKAQSLEDYLAQHPPGRVKPCDVLETLIQHCNWKHRLKNKNTASKTQSERARLVRKIFRELQTECGFKTLRYIPLTPERQHAIQQAQLLTRADGDLSRPGKSLKQSLDRFSTVMKKFGLTQKAAGVTAHGLRHELLLQTFEQHAGHPAPIRGGEPLNTARDKQARKMVAILAGHNRRRASNAYCGGSQQRKGVGEKQEGGAITPTEEGLL